MYNTAKKQVWYGELRTSRGNTIVVHDNQLPEASPGRIYLYNTERKAIVEYVEDIVKVNLYDLDEGAVKAAEAQFGGAWKAARADFMEKHQARINLSNVKESAPARKSKVEVEPEEETVGSGGDEDFGDDWGDDFDD
ncbi:hypothetical protein [Shewanella sedimentimangrovi]|uniref:Uncharacterized protein n=1 Tax=Shewanella sedimentimangrovi TaxID=2814293 RepID=A0ABX7R1T7_9GAMM|nr:hypothetical protein [Shewanella sedimentimangrovi]QSX36801.1 hypothetical protein JYB85_16220 [Shewanella sedimentimangrovi]